MRRTVSGSDSLDLLLDTICNTFGSIVFLSLLVVILVGRRTQQIPPAASQRSQARLVELQIDTERLQQQLERLRRNAQELPDLPSATAAELARLERLEQQYERLTQVRNRQLSRIAADQTRRNQLIAQAQALQRALQRVQRRVGTLRAQVRQARASAQRSMGLPRLRSSQLREAAFLVKNGRLYAVHRPGRFDNVRYEPALKFSDECRWVNRGNHTVLEPLPSKGTTLSPQNAPAVRKKLARFNPKTEHLAFFVWEDSFQHWELIRKQVEELGFRYALIPMKPENAVTRGTTQHRAVQ